MKSISIVIPTYNAGQYIEELLTKVYEQKVKPLEVIVIDSSSTDDTVSIVKRFPVKFKSIAKEQFGHGKTRNLGARVAKGDYLVYMTQDAIPMNNSWLGNLAKGLEIKHVVAGFSRQIARSEANLSDKFFYSKMYPSSSYTLAASNINEIKSVIFSNASSVISRQFLIDNPFAENILMSEDLEWAQRILDLGYKIKYNANSRVIHSHNAKFWKLLKRYFELGFSHKEISDKYQQTSFMKSGTMLVLQEFKHHLREHKITYLPTALKYNFTKFIGLELGRLHKVLPIQLKRQLMPSYSEYLLKATEY